VSGPVVADLECYLRDFRRRRKRSPKAAVSVKLKLAGSGDKTAFPGALKSRFPA
jgi:hypothetical protein